jgi:hypothetical protein
MTNERYNEIKERIDWLEDTIFYINMIDYWTREDRETLEKYEKELKQLKAKIVEKVFEE